MKAHSILAAAFVLVLVGCDRLGTHTSAAPGAKPAASAAVTADNSTPNAPAASVAAAESGSRNVVTDTIVTGKVKSAITADTGMKDADVSVKTENGVVTLTGTAKSPDQVTLASALAQRQQGVSRVENNVAVR